MLSNLLGSVECTDGIEKAFHAYDVVRRPRSQKVVTNGRETACIYEVENGELSSELDWLRKASETR